MGNWFRPVLGWFAVRERRNAQGDGEFVDAGHICPIAEVEADDDVRRHVTIEVKLFGDLPDDLPTSDSASRPALAEDVDPDPDADYTTDLGTQTLRRGIDGWDLT